MVFNLYVMLNINMQVIVFQAPQDQINHGGCFGILYCTIICVTINGTLIINIYIDVYIDYTCILFSVITAGKYSWQLRIFE